MPDNRLGSLEARPPGAVSGPAGQGAVEWELRDGLWVRVQERLRACLTDFRRIVGMPDYPEYVRHLRLVHPTWPIPSERTFFELYLQTRYGNGPTRCC